MKQYAMWLSAIAMLLTGMTGFCDGDIGTSERGVVLIEHAVAKCPSGSIQLGGKCVKSSAKNIGTSAQGKMPIDRASVKCPSGFVRSDGDCVQSPVINKGTSEKGKISPYSFKDIGTSEKGMIKN